MMELPEKCILSRDPAGHRSVAACNGRKILRLDEPVFLGGACGRPNGIRSGHRMALLASIWAATNFGSMKTERE